MIEKLIYDTKAQCLSLMLSFLFVVGELFLVFPGFVTFLELFFVAAIFEEDLVVDDGGGFSRKLVDG